MTLRTALSGALLMLLLAACAGQVSRLPPDANWDVHRSRLEALTHWSAAGKLALRTPQSSESASLDWRQRGVITRLELSGPLGMAATTFYSDGQTLEIRQGDDLSIWDLTDTGAMRRRTGWDLPLLALPHWIKGLPAPAGAIQKMELGPDPALLRELDQDGWEVRYEEYAEVGDIALPSRLSIRRGDTSVRVIIRDWQVSPE